MASTVYVPAIARGEVKLMAKDVDDKGGVALGVNVPRTVPSGLYTRARLVEPKAAPVRVSVCCCPLMVGC